MNVEEESDSEDDDDDSEKMYDNKVFDPMAATENYVPFSVKHV